MKVCFSDILNSCAQNPNFVIFSIAIGIILSGLHSVRSYYLGLITTHLRKKDLIIYIVLFLVTTMIGIYQYYRTNEEITNYNENYFERFSNIFFRADFKEIIKHNEPLLSNFNESLSNITHITKTFLEYFIPKLIAVIMTTGIFLYYLPNVGIMIGAACIIIPLVCTKLINYLDNVWDDYRISYEKFNKQFQNVMLNIWNIKYNSLENYVYNKLKLSFFEKKNKLKTWLNANIITQELPGLLFFVVLVYNLITLIDLKTMDISIRIFLILQLFKVWKEFYKMCTIYTILHKEKRNAEVICPVWMLKPKINKSEIEISNISSITFDNVIFNYGKKQILKGLNFKIKRGDIVLLLGKSGSGKSTIINLICRLYEVKNVNSMVQINNMDIKNISINSLRKYISVVPQTILTFNSSIKDNIILNKPYDSKKLMKLVKLLKIPNIKNNAKKLSYGQQQRVLIARSLYDDNKSVFIFDEYLSAVDKKTAINVHKHVIEFLKNNNKIGIFISHHIQNSNYYNKIIRL